MLQELELVEDMLQELELVQDMPQELELNRWAQLEVYKQQRWSKDEEDML